MIPFKAVFKPRKYTESGMFEGFDDSKAESVLIVDCIKTNGVPGMLFIRQDGSLDVDVIKCFSDCEWGLLLGTWRDIIKVETKT